MLIDFYSKSGKQSRIALTCALAIIAAIASYSWILHPHVSLLWALQRAQNYSELHAKKTKMIESLTKIKRIEVSKLCAQMDAVRNQFFTFATAQAFFSGLETMAAKNSCSIDSLKLLTTPKTNKNDFDDPNKTGISQHFVSLNISGSYPSIVHFLTDLTLVPQKIVVGDVTVTSNSNKSNRIDCSMQIGIYVLDPKGADNDVQE